MGGDHDTVIIGGGHAGLAMSAVLTDDGREHLVLERGRVGERWRTERWDSLRFQFPNWTLRLPRYRYEGPHPDAFAHHSEITRLLEDYAATVEAPVRTGVTVLALTRDDSNGTFHITTTDGPVTARRVVVATGPFHRPRPSPLAAGLPAGIRQTDPTRYRCPDDLPDGAVLVVGSGASGYQIADELCRAGRGVILSVSPHRRAPRRFAGRDFYWWLERLGRFDQTVVTLPDGAWPPSTVVTGVDGGYDADLRTLAAAGVELVGRTVGARDGTVHFDDDVDAVLDGADQADAAFVDLARSVLVAEPDELDGDDAVPPPDRPAPAAAPDAIDLADRHVNAVVWAIGYDDEYEWIRLPAFDGRGRPVQERGVTPTPGLYFLGRHWMHTFKSGLLAGVGADAEHVARHMRLAEGR